VHHTISGLIRFAFMKRVSFKTLGCRLNQYETDALVTQFHKAGYQIVDFSMPADITIINTCTVTNQSDQKSRNTINHAIRNNQNGLVIVTGCMANNYKAQLESNDKITYVVDNKRKSQIVPLIDAHFKGEVVHPDSYAGDIFGFEAVDQSLHTRTSIKIQDGCDNFCTYCIVPSVRGRAISRPIDQILENVRRVVDNGFKEIVITGVNIGRYDHDGLNIEGAIEKILELPGDFRVRVSSMEPDGFGPEFYRLFRHPKMTPHMHLCIQSGSDTVLLKMRRMYSVKSFMEIIEKFRIEIPGFNFTTDVIVGFPGETNEDFQKTIDLVRDAQFSHVHTFRYSRRKGTRADRMEDQLEERIKSERAEIIRKLAEKNRISFMESMVGKQQRVLIERVSNLGVAHGYGEHYLPVNFQTDDTTRNHFKEIVLNKVVPGPPPVIAGSIK